MITVVYAAIAVPTAVPKISKLQLITSTELKIAFPIQKIDIIKLEIFDFCKPK